MVLQVRGTGGTDRVRSLVDEDVRSDLENIDGVASVNIYGGRQKAIEVRLNPEACKALNLTASKISGLLSQNTQEKTFVGFADEPDSKNFVHVNAMYTKVSDLENIVVAPGPILLKDVATVFFDLKDETTYSRVNGKEAVSVALINDSQANLIELSHRVSDVIEKLNEKLAPLELEIVIQENKAETMENNINQIINLALVGGLLAVFVLWLFLKRLFFSPCAQSWATDTNTLPTFTDGAFVTLWWERFLLRTTRFFPMLTFCWWSVRSRHCNALPNVTAKNSARFP